MTTTAADLPLPSKGSSRLRLCENSLIRWNLAQGLHARDYMEVTYAQIHRGTRQAPSYLDA